MLLVVWGLVSPASPTRPASRDSIDISRNYANANVSAHVQCEQPFLRVPNASRRVSSMSEDRPADDQGEGVDSAVGLSSDTLAELVGLIRKLPEVEHRRG